jgi:lysophospholipase L1-like esterase
MAGSSLLIVLATLALTTNAFITDRTVHFGGSLSDTQEVVYLEQEQADFACKATFPTAGFTQAIFGRAAVPLFVDQHQGLFPNPYQVGPVGTPTSFRDLLVYRVQYARYQACILPQYTVSFPNTLIPILSQQINSFLAAYNPEDFLTLPPTLFTVLLGANDLAAIFEGASTAYQTVVGQEVAAGLSLAQAEQAAFTAVFVPLISQVLTDPTNGLISQVTRLAQVSPHATIVVGNTPDLTKTPEFLSVLAGNPGGVALFQSIIETYNTILASTVGKLPNVKIFDLFTLLDEAIAAAPASLQTVPCLNACIDNAACVFADPFSPSFSTNQAAANALAKLLGV